MAKKRNQRSAACTTCGRTFSRQDSLFRHTKIHLESNLRGPVHRLTMFKSFRACHHCATARTRCSGGTPCGRCELRGFDCTYPTEQPPRSRDGESKPHQHTPELQQYGSPSSSYYSTDSNISSCDEAEIRLSQCNLGSSTPIIEEPSMPIIPTQMNFGHERQPRSYTSHPFEPSMVNQYITPMPQPVPNYAIQHPILRTQLEPECWSTTKVERSQSPLPTDPTFTVDAAYTEDLTWLFNRPPTPVDYYDIYGNPTTFQGFQFQS